MEEYAVNQFAYIHQRLDQLEAERVESQRLLRIRALADTNKATATQWRRAFKRFEIVLSEFWHRSDEAATEDWFDMDCHRPDTIYLDHVRTLGARNRHRLAMRRYIDPQSPYEMISRVENTATMFARLVELDIIVLR